MESNRVSGRRNQKIPITAILETIVGKSQTGTMK